MLACLLCHLMRLQINRGKLWMFIKDMQIMNEHKYIKQQIHNEKKEKRKI